MKIAIVGSKKGTRELAPFDDLDTEIWVFNEALSQKIRGDDGEPYHWVKRANVVFQMHDPAVYRSKHNRSDSWHWDWLQEKHGDLRIYMQDVDPDVPNSVRYPREEINKLLSDFRQGLDLQAREFLTSSVAQAFALAILQKPERILVFGVDMESETEYWYQRECVTFWIGLALGKGIPVDMYSGDDIFSRPTYGYEGYVWAEPVSFKEKMDIISPDIADMKNRIHEFEMEMDEHWQEKDIDDYIKRLGALYTLFGNYEGQYFELNRYRFKSEEYISEGKPAYIDRNEYELAAAQAHRDLESFGPMVYRTVGHVDIGFGTYKNTRNPVHLEQFKQWVKEHMDAIYNFGRAQGIYDINRELAFEMDRHLKAAGGIKTVQSLLKTPEQSKLGA